MRSTFHSLEISKRALFTQQAALSTTGHNIANANTEGYSRQVVNMKAARPIEAVGLSHSTAPGQLGMGVEFDSITRIREKFLDDQFRNENKSLGSWSVRQDTLEKLETIIAEPSETGIRTVVNNFFKAWSDLSKDPEKTDGRKIVREAAMAMADAFNTTSRQLEDLKGDLTANINVTISQVNTQIDSISRLNAEIQRVEGLGDNANDLRDQRDLLTDQLSKIVNIQVQDSPQGYTITMGSVALVEGAQATPLTADSVSAAYGSGALNNGEIHGMILSRDKYVADYQNQIDTLVNTIANGEIEVTIPKGSVLPNNTVLGNKTYTGADRELKEDLTVKVNGLNGLHKLGYIFSDTPTAAGDFFTGTTGTTFQVNPDIVNNPNLIATSLRTTGTGTSDTVIKGNNTMALLISGLTNTKFTFPAAVAGTPDTKATMDDFFRSTVGQLGVQTQEATRQAGNQKVLTDQVDSRRQSVSQVSLDEEMSNMIKFQHAYNAAARAMTTFDEMLDKVINSMGVVGR
ncbi:flagellar hook-associated protein FlgK [Paenibacillus aurantius]|uniref:Flagellar hook-associated protein 1 n=1 Tax=Paenibacillus aurantius TaxID=2918900 RepID=A0AA96LE93_9BACL|nr:flagellar hook-associated protein FlgK [Paenibacillus aurantius]WNQ11599.1 flagellar hook-associated protein FlgK [Paenibacillus aurantius]